MTLTTEKSFRAFRPHAKPGLHATTGGRRIFWKPGRILNPQTLRRVLLKGLRDGAGSKPMEGVA